MTPLGKIVRNLAERVAKTFYEGPTPPARFRQMAEEFAKMYPHATRRQWVDFSAKLAGDGFGSGYTRGYEWAERDLDRLPKDDPDVLAHQARHDWEWTGGGIYPGPDNEVIDEMPPLNAKGEQMQAIYQREAHERQRTLGIKNRDKRRK